METINENSQILPHVKLGLDLYGLNSCTESKLKQFKRLEEMALKMASTVVGIIGMETSSDTEEFFAQPAHSVVSLVCVCTISSQLFLIS